MNIRQKYNLSILPFFLTVLTILLCACDAEHLKDYYVTNKLDSTVKFKYSVMGKIDSVNIQINEERLIYSYSYIRGMAAVDDDREKDPIDNFLVYFDRVVKGIKENAWNYEKIEKYHANYRLVIDTSLIK
jgi:hypothetical protein